jgi:MFS family permease
MVCRFILGIVEAPFFPGVLFYLSRWYTKEELNFRMSIFYSGALIAGAFGNLIAAGILHGLEGVHGIASWQWLYILEGVVTVVIGAAAMFILPDFPQTWRALSPELKAVGKPTPPHHIMLVLTIPP